jgi:uroporphyrinogen decarboxylase
VGGDKAVMGNLDPAALLAPWRELRFRVDAVLAGANGRPGHIFNLGHGIFPNTPVDNVRRLVDYVHERSSKQ